MRCPLTVTPSVLLGETTVRGIVVKRKLLPRGVRVYISSHAAVKQHRATAADRLFVMVEQSFRIPTLSSVAIFAAA